MTRTLFVTGTDTEIGKTTVACGIVSAARAQGWQVSVFKPVAAGCEDTAQGLRNADALALQRAANSAHPYALVNPYALREPIAPHVAAADEGVDIDPEHLVECYQRLADGADLVVVEGAGGWAVPLAPGFGFADLVARMQWPVLLVVGMRLGCLNHAQLSAEAIARRCRLMGWIANCLPPRQPRLAENMASLQRLLPAPWLGTVTAADSASAELDFSRIRDAL